MSDDEARYNISMRYAPLAAIFLVGSWLWADDPTVDWLLQTQTTTAPSTRATAAASSSRPAVPLVRTQGNLQPLSGVITLSNGKTLTGIISTTPGKPLRVWVEEEHQYHDLELSEITSIAATVVWERQQPEWHFVNSGSDIKEFTGRNYPARELAYSFTLKDGTKITGGVVAPIYLETSDQKQLELVLHKRDKGEMGKALDDLVYIKTIECTAR